VQYQTDWLFFFFQEDANAPQLGDGIELMIPANKHLYGFLPSIIQNLIEKNIDLSAEYVYMNLKKNLARESFNLLLLAGCQQPFGVLATYVMLHIRYSMLFSVYTESSLYFGICNLMSEHN
jgi:hypothetical protein